MRGWLAKRRRRRLRQDEFMQALRDEYEAKLDARDPEALTTSRDWGDNDGAPWRFEVWAAAGFLALIIGVPLLVAFFLLIKSLTS